MGGEQAWLHSLPLVSEPVRAEASSWCPQGLVGSREVLAALAFDWRLGPPCPSMRIP
jgi:hypothetical protein